LLILQSCFLIEMA